MFVFSGDKRGPQKCQPHHKKSDKGFGPVYVPHQGVGPLKMTMGIEAPEAHLHKGEDDHKGEQYDNEPPLEFGKGLIKIPQGFHGIS